MIHIVIGTKAQLIKMAPLMKYLKEQNIDYNYIYTGQHRDTMEDIHQNFGIKSFDKVLHDKGDIISVFVMVLWFLKLIFITLFRAKSIFNNDRNGVVLVHGDTISTLIGAIMGKFARVKVAHIESGLRSFNLFHPFPEEITRVLTFKLTDISFCPGDWAVENLKKYKMEKVDTKGNTLYDSLIEALPAISNIDGVTIPSEDYCVVTIHRFENLSSRDRMRNLVDYLNKLSESIKVIFILHNPTKKALKKFQLQFSDRVELRSRYDYFRFIKLISHAQFVVSDGGSNQEECYYLGKPILLYRMATEREEGIGHNCVISKYDSNTIESFFSNYKQYDHGELNLEISPVEIITDRLRSFNKLTY